MTAAEQFNKAYNEYQDKIKVLNNLVKKLKVAQKAESTNWGYTGSMQKVTADVNEIIDFLSH